MHVVIAGGRNYDPDLTLKWLMANFHTHFPFSSVIVHGACGLDLHGFNVTGKMRGADLGADNFAILAGLPVIRIPAQWTRLGKAAGTIRNVEMFDRHVISGCILFPGNNGTKHCGNVAVKHGVSPIYANW